MQTNAVSDRLAGEKEKGERRNERVQDVISHEKCSSNQINFEKSINPGLPDQPVCHNTSQDQETGFVKNIAKPPTLTFDNKKTFLGSRHKQWSVHV